jgi:hypothetical protein
VVSARAGRSTLGCLVTLLILSAAGYFAVNVGEVYLRYYRYRDGFQQQARFANQRTDERIRVHLRALADSLGLPDEARLITVRRTPRRIVIRARYTEVVEMPGYVREFHFEPLGEARF